MSEIHLVVEHEGWRTPITVTDELLKTENNTILGAFFATVVEVTLKHGEALDPPSSVVRIG